MFIKNDKGKYKCDLFYGLDKDNLSGRSCKPEKHILGNNILAFGHYKAEEMASTHNQKF